MVLTRVFFHDTAGGHFMDADARERAVDEPQANRYRFCLIWTRCVHPMAATSFA